MNKENDLVDSIENLSKKYKKVLAHYIYMRIIVKARPKRESEKSLKKMVKKN